MKGLIILFYTAFILYTVGVIEIIKWFAFNVYILPPVLSIGFIILGFGLMNVVIVTLIQKL